MCNIACPTWRASPKGNTLCESGAKGPRLERIRVMQSLTRWFRTLKPPLNALPNDYMFHEPFTTWRFSLGDLETENLSSIRSWLHSSYKVDALDTRASTKSVTLVWKTFMWFMNLIVPIASLSIISVFMIKYLRILSFEFRRKEITSKKCTE